MFDRLSLTLVIGPAWGVRTQRYLELIACWFFLGAKQEDGKYKHTVDLPKTTFGLRANAVMREPELQKLWEENQVLKRVSERNTGVSLLLQVKL